MALPIAIQLYTVRDAMAADFVGTIQKIADFGYAGVEGAGVVYQHTPPKEAAKLFKDLGLTVMGAHETLPLGDDKNAVLDRMGIMETKKLICPWRPPEKFKSVDSIKAICEELNAADVVARENGLSLLYHNHWFEYETLDGKPVNQIMQENLAPTVGLEIDTYWVKVGGQNPAQVVKDAGSRAPLLHIKDGPASSIEANMVAVGDGVMDWDAIIGAGQGSTEWLIVELDRCSTDMLEAVGKSYTYLTGKGFARGR
ncbi:MAG: sugar phosphate isomerase/epimerase [Chloroflexota bacterium]